MQFGCNSPSVARLHSQNGVHVLNSHPSRTRRYSNGSQVIRKSFSGVTRCRKSVIFFQVSLFKVYVFGAYYLGEVLLEIANLWKGVNGEFYLGEVVAA